MGEDGISSNEEICRFRRPFGFLQKSGIPLKNGRHVGMIWAIRFFFKPQSPLILIGGFVIFLAIFVIRGKAVQAT